MRHRNATSRHSSTLLAASTARSLAVLKLPLNILDVRFTVLVEFRFFYHGKLDSARFP